jgi:hypothetical protein
MNHERNKAQVAYLSARERAPSQEGVPLVTLGGAHSKIAHRGRAPSQGSAPLLRSARPSSRGRALFNCKGLFQKFAHRGRAPSQGSAPLLRRARPSCPGGSSRINKARIRHSFALKMNVGARGLGHNLCIRYSLAVLFT